MYYFTSNEWIHQILWKQWQKHVFFIKDDEVWEKFEKIWDMINRLGNDMPKENMHYTCIACKTIDSVVRIDKKNHLQVYLEEWKYKTKKIQMSKFMNAELKSDSGSELDSEE